jgi:hypothetical protein
VGHKVKKVFKAVVNPVKAIKSSVKVAKSLVHGDIKGALGHAMNYATGGYLESKARRTNEVYQKQMSEINALEQANELRTKQRNESNAMLQGRQANPYEADSSALLEAKDNPSSQTTLLTGAHGLDPSEMPLGRQSLLGGGM